MENEEISMNDLKNLIVQLNTEIKTELGTFKTEVKNEFTGVKGEITGIKDEIGGLKEEVANLNIRLSRVESKVDTLEDRSFTEQEKSDILTTIQQYNQRLEHEVLGKNNISLNRTEYDATSEKVGFINRFEEIETATN